MKKQIIFGFVIFASVAFVLAKAQDENAKCDEPIDKSAVTKEAADAAAKFIKNPPAYNTDVYSSKVKSWSLWNFIYID